MTHPNKILEGLKERGKINQADIDEEISIEEARLKIDFWDKLRLGDYICVNGRLHCRVIAKEPELQRLIAWCYADITKGRKSKEIGLKIIRVNTEECRKADDGDWEISFCSMAG